MKYYDIVFVEKKENGIRTTLLL